MKIDNPTWLALTLHRGNTYYINIMRSLRWIAEGDDSGVPGAQSTLMAPDESWPILCSNLRIHQQLLATTGYESRVERLQRILRRLIEFSLDDDR